MAVLGLASVLATNLWVYSVVLLGKGVCYACIYQSAFLIGSEFLGGSYRFWGSSLVSIVFVLGALYTSALSWIVQQWRYVEAFNLILILFLCSYAW